MKEELFEEYLKDQIRIRDKELDKFRPFASAYEMKKEIERLNNIIKYTDSWIDRTIEIIKQQPSEDDTWILERLNGIKQCLQGSDKE